MSDNVISLEAQALLRRGAKLLPKPSEPLKLAVFNAVCKSSGPGRPDDLSLEDTFLAQLWIEGFKVVPIGEQQAEEGKTR